MKFFSASAIAATLMLGAAVPSAAATLVPDTGPEFGNWTRFYFGGVGSSITDGATGDDFWDVTLTSAGELHVTDAFVVGDQWDVLVDGVSVGLTGAFDTSGPTTGDPNVAFGGAVYSWLSYSLAAGTYQIKGITNLSPTGSGGSFLRVVTAEGGVPEPATWAMMIAGFCLVGFAARRRNAVAISA